MKTVIRNYYKIMKILMLLLLILFSLAACQKEKSILPQITQGTSTAMAVTVTKPDTIPDGAEFKLKLVKDNINSDETVFVFNHKASLRYIINEDAPYFWGNGQVNLASISSDGINLSINGLPYTPGVSIGLDVQMKTNGSYSLKISYENKIPPNIGVWLKDNYLKDSVNVRSQNYNFNVIKADTNSFCAKRFKLIIKSSGHQ